MGKSWCVPVIARHTGSDALLENFAHSALMSRHFVVFSSVSFMKMQISHALYVLGDLLTYAPEYVENQCC